MAERGLDPKTSLQAAVELYGATSQEYPYLPIWAITVFFGTKVCRRIFKKNE